MFSLATQPPRLEPLLYDQPPALVALVALVGIGAVQKGASTTLTGTTLYLRDAEGKPRVVATATEAKGPLLAFMDDQGVTRLSVGLVGKEARVET